MVSFTRPEECRQCPYVKSTMSFASYRGNMAHDVMIVLEALGEQEALEHKPAVGPTGKLLNRMIERTTDPASGKLFKNTDFLITNTVWCRPFEFIGGKVVNRTPSEYEEASYCPDLHLLPLIEKLQPKAILAAGAVPFRALTGRAEGIAKLRGYMVPMLGTNVPVVGTYHPAYLMKGKLSLVRVWQMDFLKAIYLAREGSLPYVERVYHEDPPVAEWNILVGQLLKQIDKGAMLSFDIETPYAGAMKDELIDPEELRLEDDESFNIFRISFCVEPNVAVSVPWDTPYLQGIYALLATNGIKIVWNRFYDIPRVEHNGAKVNGLVYDGMDIWHFTEPGFPMGLKYATTFVAPDMPPWMLEKTTRPAWYNAADSDTAMRVVLWCRERLKAEKRWDTFLSHFVALGQRLQKISLRGIPTSAEKRKEKRELYEKRFAQEKIDIQPLVPDDVKPVGKPFKSPEKKLRETGKWREGRMVPMCVTRRETRDDIPEEKRCDNAKCPNRMVRELDGKRRCEKHMTKKMKESA